MSWRDENLDCVAGAKVLHVVDRETINTYLKWLDARAERLYRERMNGGNAEHLSARESECRLAFERLKELLPSADRGEPR